MNLIKKVLDKLKRDGIWLTTIAIQQHFSYKNFSQRLAYKKMFQRETLQERFSDIYEGNFWNSNESRSGEGSEIEYTKPLRSWLIKAIPKYKIERFVDAPCGDFNWMRVVLPEVDVEYYGYDIVETIVSRNKENYSGKNVHFGVANICKDELPKCDLLMVRDCLFHLSFKDINKFLDNIAKIDYKYLLTTTYILDKGFVNKDISTGDWRLINLFAEPFNFKNETIIEFVDDSPKGHKLPRQMIFIAKENVPSSINYNGVESNQN
jgi:hypothetical protein